MRNLINPAHELFWRWHQSEGDLGIHSNWEGMVNTAVGIQYDVWNRTGPEANIASIRRLRSIDDALNRISRTYSLALYATHGHVKPFPIKIVEAYSEFSACAIIVSKMNIGQLEKLVSIQSPSSVDWMLRTNIKTNAQELYRKAHSAFANELAKVRCNN